ncbi:MAG: ABC transporter permease subunit [Flavobacteriales bacterium]|jgi:Cu-processing system permease protein|nr:ABC transporter permease subunit [Flavobacteriales bacterium]MBK6884210.1 ABC transporter permease subunit [Flavobacteriales bacterium]MBK7100591.1 ABC transporter permease subunit [Flavobacteriales bacterium]MBK7111287.1 ABC transporter permease subunit [Flavobacteriales bacterium]MBK7484352.1 ABC transporter permease subunit [Flavobacteriales bacterium]
MLKVFKYTLIDLARNRFVLGYALLMLFVAEGLFFVEDDPSKALLSLVQVVMALVPLIALVFTIVYSYDSLEFTQLLAVQPIARRSILAGQLLALCTALLVAQGFGLGLPLIVHLPNMAALMLSFSGSGLVLVFTALGLLIALKQREKARGVGVGLTVWFLFVLVYDALLMALMFSFSDHPIEPFVVPLAALNPIDMGRILVMLQVDLAAMMGYSGAVYKDFFGSYGGIAVAAAVLLLWFVVPTLFSFRTFQRKDL